MRDHYTPQDMPDVQSRSNNRAFEAHRSDDAGDAETKTGAIHSTHAWLLALSTSIRDDDRDGIAQLKDITDGWTHDTTTQRYMSEILDNVANLDVHW